MGSKNQMPLDGRDLLFFYFDLLQREKPKTEPGTPNTPRQTHLQETSYFCATELDLEAVIASSQELSSIVEVEQLCNTLLEIVVKNAGATKGVLLFEKEGSLVIQSAILGSSTTLGKALLFLPNV
jgi:hypothetical protein